MPTTAEYDAIDPAERIQIHQISLKLCESKIAQLEAEAASRGSTAWLARRQLPMKRRDRATILKLIERAQNELNALPVRSNDAGRSDSGTPVTNRLETDTTA